MFAVGLAALLTGGFTGGCSEEPAVTTRTDLPVVYAVVETEPVRGKGDAADDPAIWIHPEDASASLILGTDKRLGLSVYDLSGREVQFLRRGRINNVDLRQGVAMAEGPVTLAAATNRTERAMDIYRVSRQGRVELALAQPLEMEDPYGICMHLDGAGVAYAYVNGSDGAYEIWRLNAGGNWRPNASTGSRCGPSRRGAWSTTLRESRTSARKNTASGKCRRAPEGPRRKCCSTRWNPPA